MSQTVLSWKVESTLTQTKQLTNWSNHEPNNTIQLRNLYKNRSWKNPEFQWHKHFFFWQMSFLPTSFQSCIIFTNKEAYSLPWYIQICVEWEAELSCTNMWHVQSFPKTTESMFWPPKMTHRGHWSLSKTFCPQNDTQRSLFVSKTLKLCYCLENFSSEANRQLVVTIHISWTFWIEKQSTLWLLDILDRETL